ncbi:MAG: hypothetical protein AAF387_19975, partial [Pseudomonadota bacterium]
TDDYSALSHLLSKLGAGNHKLYAGPDAPEIPVIAGSSYWHPALYDIFEPEYSKGAETFEDQLGKELRKAEVDIIVFNIHPAFSRRMSNQFLSRLATEYGHAAVIGDRFFVLWSEDVAANIPGN